VTGCCEWVITFGGGGGIGGASGGGCGGGIGGSGLSVLCGKA
jgi:hypothetical protein